MNAFRLDLRSLAVCRILAGLTVMADLFWRAGELTLHYTEAGVWPVALAKSGQIFPTLYFLAFTKHAVLLLFVLHGLAGFALTLGYRTQLATIVCWYLTRSLHVRQPWLLNGGDYLFAMLLFWAIFVPWGARFSLDGSPESDRLTPPARLACAIFAFQLPVVYWVSLLHKLEPEWLGGQALYYALNSSLFARPWGSWLLFYPEYLPFLGYLFMGWEAIGPFLLLSPWPKARVIAGLGFLVMHFGLLAFLRVGMFAWAPVLFLAALMPGALWSRLIPETFTKRIYSSRPHRLPPEATPLLIFLMAVGLIQAPGLREPSLLAPGLRWVETGLGLRQDWRMFTKLAQLSDGWLVLEAELHDGRKVDLLRSGRSLLWHNPDFLTSRRPQDRWAGYLWMIANEEGPERLAFVNAMVQQFELRVRRARLVYLRKSWLLDQQDKAPEPELLAEWIAP